MLPQKSEDLSPEHTSLANHWVTALLGMKSFTPSNLNTNCETKQAFATKVKILWI